MHRVAGIAVVWSFVSMAAPALPLRAEFGAASHSDVSPPLWLLPPAKPVAPFDHEPMRLPRPPSTGAPDPIIQRWRGPVKMPATSTVFEGVGNGLVGPAGTYSVQHAPPDTNGAIGPAHYVQIVNSAFAVFRRDGTPIYGPMATNTLWSGLGGLCETDNDGDGVVLYDRAADRWVISQLAVKNATTAYYECVAVSQTGDPTGAWARYAFAYANFDDYPKLAVWPDAYYVTFNMFSSSFLGTKACAYDRTKMLAGLPATQQCFDFGSSYGGLLPTDLDGAQAPPAGSPNFIAGLGASANELVLFKFHVDWNTPANSTVSAPTTIPVAAFTEACGGATCIPQNGTTLLDSLADRVMFRLAYRRFSDHESLVVNHSVAAGSSTGIRWYELRNPNGTITLAQQGTYAPDNSYRWMGSVAMDQAGNMALGYSVSSSSSNPSIRFTGRLASDPPNQMGQGESTMKAGAGSQTGSLTRWGDYSSISIDPLDDCTFWYTTEDLPSDGSFNWQTWIGSFKFDTCPADDFTLTLAPSIQTVPQLSSSSYSVQATVIRGTPGQVTLSVAGLPVGLTGSFSPAALTPDGGSTLTLSAGGSAPAVTDASFSVRGTSSAVSRFASAQVTVPLNDFALSAPAGAGVPIGGSNTVIVNTSVLTGISRPLTLTVSGLPAGVTGAFAPVSLDAGIPSTLTLSAASGLPVSDGGFTVTGTSAVATHQALVPLSILTPPTAQLTAPDAGARLSGAVTLSATAQVSAGTRLDRIEFYVDATRIEPAATTSPASIAWNTIGVSNGSHLLTARVYDAAGDLGTSLPVPVTLSNAVAGCSCAGEPQVAPLLGALAALLSLALRRSARGGNVSSSDASNQG